MHESNLHPAPHSPTLEKNRAGSTVGDHGHLMSKYIFQSHPSCPRDRGDRVECLHVLNSLQGRCKNIDCFHRNPQHSYLWGVKGYA